jgi:hypothetical protein
MEIQEDEHKLPEINKFLEKLGVSTKTKFVALL